MKRTKALAIVLAVAVVLSMGSIAFAAGEPDIGQGAQAGKADSTVTLTISETPPVSISATVPLTIPLAIKVGDADAGVTTYAPTDCKIVNTSVNFDDTPGAVDPAITVTDVTASPAPGAKTWSLVEAAPKAVTADANKIQLGMCGSVFGDLDITAGGSVSLTGTVATGYQNIPSGEDRNLSVTATAGGIGSDYSNLIAGGDVTADIFKVQFTIEAA